MAERCVADGGSCAEGIEVILTFRRDDDATEPGLAPVKREESSVAPRWALSATTDGGGAVIPEGPADGDCDKRDGSAGNQP